VILVLAEDEFGSRALPPWLTKLAEERLTVLWVQTNSRSYKKLIPVLKAYPDSTIVTADDDTIYPPNWLEQLVDASALMPRSILGHRGTTITFTAEGDLRPYAAWPPATRQAVGPTVFLTGVGGILYPPYSLAPVVTDVERALRLCPTADDIWFWANAVLAGSRRQLIADTPAEFPQARNSQRGGNLMSVNIGSQANDSQIRAVLDHFQLWPQLFEPGA